MEKNINILGRLVRILIGMAFIYFAIKAASKEGEKSKKVILTMVIVGFIGVVQGYSGVCVAKKLGLPIPF